VIKLFNNKTEKVGDDLKNVIKKGSKLSIAASIFTIYGFESLKTELKKIDKLRFIFTDPTFVETDKNKREIKQFQINTALRQQAISGSDFEINLKNELKGRAIAKECRKWIEQKVTFKSNAENRCIQPFLIAQNPEDRHVYLNLNEFSSVGLGYEKDNSILNSISKISDAETTKSFLKSFEEIWNNDKLLKDITGEVTAYIANLYKENSPEFIYFLTLYNIFDEFLLDISEDELANDKTGFKDSTVWNMLYDFQKDAVLGIINKLERYNGCILADSVGLGKTFSALGVIKYYQERNRSILVLCPKKLGDNWLTFLNNYDDNPLVKDRLNYTVLHHTDLSRETGISNGVDLSRINWGNYDLVVIDESHNFRNASTNYSKVSRYQRLMDDVIKSGVTTKVLMLSATPVNNRFADLKNQLALAYEGKTHLVDTKLGTNKSIDTILRNAQMIFNEWTKLPPKMRTGEELLKKLNTNIDFFKLLDSVTISRSRKHIEKYYDSEQVGKFPFRLPPKNYYAEITDLEGFMEISAIYNELSKLKMSIYSPIQYILSGKESFYEDLYDTSVSENLSFKQSHREKSLQTLMRINLLKRLESSVESFRITLKKLIKDIEKTLSLIEEFDNTGQSLVAETTYLNEVEYDTDSDDWLDDEFSVGEKIKVNLEDMDTRSWKHDLKIDLSVAQNIYNEMKKVVPEHDSKLKALKDYIAKKIEKPINENNKKVLVFSAFADTVDYLYKQLAPYNIKEFGLHTAMITGRNQNKSTLEIDHSFNNILINFSPRSKQRKSKTAPEIDILIATDCISEGQNLQDCDLLINYDIHWNPVRIIQRFGRIDRIGSINENIQLINFWPQLSLDDYINLKNRVESKMFIVDATATGEDNVLTNQSSDSWLRKKQLEKIKEEVIDLEDMGNGVSITDLGLNDFRMDLINYINKNEHIKKAAKGLHTVCMQDPKRNIVPGVVFVLKNINNDVNIENSNQLHPFYLVYIKEDGTVFKNHLNVKATLDMLRSVCRNQKLPIPELYEPFNEETDDGKNMQKYSDLLNATIESILNVKDESDVDSLFSEGGTNALLNNIRGLDDFELITFFIIK